MMSMNFRGIAILNINGVGYRCIVNGISKSEAVHLLEKTICHTAAKYTKDPRGIFR